MKDCDGNMLDPDELIYCRICDEMYAIRELREWDGADRPRLLCPGCADELIDLHWADDDIEEEEEE